ncbi:MAG: MBL fold metallo-hydrolase [Actinobacteria bacterium]|nr:MBL fold metallo-hydrolase [Actinomycetota bacterium]
MATNTGMRAVSEAQLRAATEGGVPEPERIGAQWRGSTGSQAESVGTELWSVAVPMPEAASRGGAAGLGYTLSGILIAENGAVTVVDPGWETPEAHAELDRMLAAQGRGIGDIAHIVVTHAHPDHVGAADALRRISGAKLLMHEREQAGIERVRASAVDGDGGGDPADFISAWGVPGGQQERLAEQLLRTRRSFGLPDPAEVLLRDGDRLPVEGAEWQALWTPGHTAGHLCLVDEERRLLFTGDHVLPTMFPGLGLGIDLGLRLPGESNPVADHLASLERLRPYADYEVLPGHGYRFTGLTARLDEMQDHIRTRAGEVGRALAADPEATVWEIAPRLSWSAGWERLSASPMLASALLQTGYYAEFVRNGGLESA